MQASDNALSPWRRQSTTAALLATALFLLVAGFSTYHHEMWRDEMGPWLIARDTASLFDIFHNIRYEGHPSLWFLLIWPLKLFSANPQVIQWLNLGICALAVFIIVRFAPAPLWMRLAVALGYFPVYEYGSIARNYSLGLLALAAFCAVFPGRDQRPILLGFVLLLAANTSMLACLLAIAAVIMLALEGAARKPSSSSSWIAIGIAVAGIILAVYQMIPPSDSGYAMGWHFDFSPTRIGEVLGNMTASYLPLPNPGPFFWETHLLNAFPFYGSLSWLLAPVVMATVALALLRRPLALIYYLIGSCALLSFFYVKHVGYLRHHGFLFICFGTALWLAATLRPVSLPAPWDSLSQKAERAGLLVLPLLLALHVAGAAIAVTCEHNYTFSAAGDTADLIREHGLEKLPMVADIDITAMPVLGYLNKKTAFYPCGDRYGSYVLWDKARMQHTVVWEEAPVIAAKASSPLVIVVDDFITKKFPVPSELQSKVELIGCTKSEVVADESYCVYRYDPKGIAR